MLSLFEGEIQFPSATFRQFGELKREARDFVGMISLHLAEISAPDFIWTRFRVDLEDLPPFPLLFGFLLSMAFSFPPIFLASRFSLCAMCESRPSYLYPTNNTAKHQ